jgi:cytochrome d ubiquinol oxidase subunit I
VTPFLTARAASTSLAVFGAVYTLIFAFGTYYIYRLLRAGPSKHAVKAAPAAFPNRPMSFSNEDGQTDYVGAGE